MPVGVRCERVDLQFRHACASARQMRGLVGTQVYETPAEIAMEEDNVRRSTTPAYRAPEMWDLMTRKRIDTKVDIWVRAQTFTRPQLKFSFL